MKLKRATKGRKEETDLLSIGADRGEAYLVEQIAAVLSQLSEVTALKAQEIYMQELQDSRREVLELKHKALLDQRELLKSYRSQKPDISRPGLEILKSRWDDLKRFSIYDLYQDCNLRGQGLTFNSDEEMFSFLVTSSNAKIDQIIQIDDDRLVSRDSFTIPGMCYKLLAENAELRKMCSAYQLKVLLMSSEENEEKARAGKTVKNPAALQNSTS